jgi:polyhydroxybutyrate depolymerase
MLARFSKKIVVAPFVGALMLCLGCSDTPSSSDAILANPELDSMSSPVADAGTGDIAEGEPATKFGGDRPVKLEVPASYDSKVATPLLLLLHGYGASGAVQAFYLGYQQYVDTGGFLFAAPDGTTNADGKKFWNASDACCDFEKTGVDDVAYITSLIDDISATYNVDSKRIYLIGHSNGGFMSYRMACEKSDRIAAIISLAGASFKDATDCKPSAKVSILQIHGDEDNVILFAGGINSGVPYPGAEESVEQWAAANSCQTTRETSGSWDLVPALSGAETEGMTSEGCPAGVDVDLWRIKGGGHVPFFSAEFAAQTWKWLASHSK